jgi:hypothetical protein
VSSSGEFRTLFTKFRIGTVRDASPNSWRRRHRRAALTRRCADCHAPDEEAARETGSIFVERMRRLTTATARAERLLLAARRGGVDVRQAATHVDAAVATQIELEVLVHTFSSAPEGPFSASTAGIQHAETALAGARTALDELEARRRGLLVFLGVLALALVALILKIRDLSAD